MRFGNILKFLFLTVICAAVLASCSERPENTRKGNPNSQAEDPTNQEYNIGGVTGIKSGDEYVICTCGEVEIVFYRYGSGGAEFRLVNRSSKQRYVETSLVALDGVCYSETRESSDEMQPGETGSLNLDFPDSVKPKKLSVRFCCYDENYDYIPGSLTDTVEIERDSINWLAPRSASEIIFSDSDVTVEYTGFDTAESFDTVNLRLTNNTNNDLMLVLYDPTCPEGNISGHTYCNAPAGGKTVTQLELFSDIDPSYLCFSVKALDLKSWYELQHTSDAMLFVKENITVPITADPPAETEPEEPEEPENHELTLTEYEEDLLREYINAGFEEFTPISAELEGGSPTAELDDGNVAVHYVTTLTGNDEIEGDMLAIFLKIRNDTDEIVDGTAQCTVNGITLPPDELEAAAPGVSKLVHLYYPMSSMTDLFGELSDICFDISFTKTPDLYRIDDLGHTGLFTLRFAQEDNRPDLTKDAKEIYSDDSITIYERGRKETGYLLVVDLYTVNKTDQPLTVKLDESESDDADSDLNLWLFGSVLNIPAEGGGLMIASVSDLNSGSELSADMADGLAMHAAVFDSSGEKLSEGEAIL